MKCLYVVTYVRISRESETFSWIGYGSNVGSLHTWHHSCLKVDMIKGVTQVKFFFDGTFLKLASKNLMIFESPLFFK